MTVQHMLVTALGVALVARPVFADDATSPDRERTKAQVEQTLKGEGHLSDKAIAALSKDVDKNSGQHGYGDAISDTVHKALASGCTGTCLAEAIHQVNHAMDQGHPADESAEMVGKAMAGAKGTEAQRRDHVRRDMTMALRDSARERMHDRAADMGGSHGGSSMHGGGK